MEGGALKVLLEGDEISERYFDEVFTQTAPSKISLSVGLRLQGRIDSYTLVEPLGSGAVGHVWSARPAKTGSGKLVAVKVMLPREDLLADSKIVDVRERFRREARNGPSLEHPNIIRYLDLGELQDNPFLIMELGSASVGRILKSVGRMSLKDSTRIVLAVVEGLTYLHGRGGPHRDVKPDNILAVGETFKLADLGIVKWSDFNPRLTFGGTITRDSMQLGSWFYMAPEQQQHAHDATPESDIYALGVSWIEMLTGELPAPHAIGAAKYPNPCDDLKVCALIQRMVSYAPSARATLSDIRYIVEDRGE